MDANGKGILNKIFKGQHTRQQPMHHQNYVDHLNQTHQNLAFQSGRNANGVPNIMSNVKSPNNNIREHLHTQGRSRGQNQTLEAGPGASLGNHQRGGSLNIQELYNHYQKGYMGTNGRNVTYYSNKNPSQNMMQF